MDHQSLESYNYHLPMNLIAQYPLERRDQSRMLVVYPNGELVHQTIADLPQYLDSSTFMVFNNSKVLRSRLYGQKATGGKCEVLLFDCHQSKKTYTGMAKYRGKKRRGDILQFDELVLKVISLPREMSGSFEFEVVQGDVVAVTNNSGHIPLPPYIRKGVAQEDDQSRYQTVYAKTPGSVAAPTAGLHFTPELLQEVNKKCPTTTVTLHVGAGTFLPVSSEDITNHDMHSESYLVEQNFIDYQKDGKSPLFVGTTSLRAGESWYLKKHAAGEFNPTELFLHPGNRPQIPLKGLLTNFHLPESSLLMLVASLIGVDKMKEVYQKAIEKSYRFYSYGDCMLILK